MRKIYSIVGLVALVAFGFRVVSAQSPSAGGVFLPLEDYVVSGQWLFKHANPLRFEGATDDDFETTVTAADPTADRTLTMPNATDTLVGRATTDTLTNKTLTAPVIGTSLTLSGRTTVTQVTSITTGVTINAQAGSVTTVSAATAAGAEDRFTVTNSAVGANDVVMAVLASTTSAGGPLVAVDRVAAGSFQVVITNLDAAAALNNTLTINFVVLKAS